MNKDLRKQFISGIKEKLSDVVSPTPYFLISETDGDVKFLNGSGLTPKKDNYEVTVLDLSIASFFFDDINLLFEGVTGIGKTYTLEALYKTVFGSNGYYSIRLSSGVLGNSPFTPFTDNLLDNGIPKIVINHDKCKSFGALFIDEINRGDLNEVLQVIDGTINLNGDKGYLRLPIRGTNRFKKINVVGAMNPPDGQHVAASELDIAGENRFIKLKFPNGVIEAASSQLEKKLSTDKMHDELWSELGFNNWKDGYPIITDSSQFNLVLNGANKEFLDTILGYVGEAPIKVFNRNKEIIDGLNLSFNINESDNTYNKIIESQKSLKHGFVRRDLTKINNLSHLLSFVKGTKNGSYDLNVSLEDLTASIGIVLESKLLTGSNHGSLMNLVKEGLNAYKTLRTELNTPNNFGVRDSIFQAAVYQGVTKGFDDYLKVIDNNISKINVNGDCIADSVIKSRLIADLCVLKDFSNYFAKDFKKAFKLGFDACFDSIINLYKDNKGLASVYEQRLGPILG